MFSATLLSNWVVTGDMVIAFSDLVAVISMGLIRIRTVSRSLKPSLFFAIPRMPAVWKRSFDAQAGLSVKIIIVSGLKLATYKCWFNGGPSSSLMDS